ncbi:hypothetical protein, partial [Acetobacter nitrogenifigens]|uniref:hypothetical protein n=1 Tax=Acetobacter nitrogenifigens TaxID=285268 RepID=UPI002230CCA9
ERANPAGAPRTLALGLGEKIGRKEARQETQSGERKRRGMAHQLRGERHPGEWSGGGRRSRRGAASADYGLPA